MLIIDLSRLHLLSCSRCQIPELGNDTYAIQGPNHNSLVHKYIPLDVDGVYDKCNLFNIDQSAASFDNDSRPINANKTKCSAWVYDKTLFYDTFVMKVNFKSIQTCNMDG